MTIELALPTTRPESGTLVETLSDDFHITQDVPADAILRVALGGCPSKKHMMELVCELLGDPTTDQVRSLLTRGDARVSRQHASKVVNGWRRNHRCAPRPDDLDQDARAAITEPVAVSPSAAAPTNGENPMVDRTTFESVRSPVDASITNSYTKSGLDASPTDEPAPDDQRVDASPVVDPTVDDGSGLDPRAVDAQPRSSRRVRVWPLLLIGLPAAVAVWSGWVGLGEMTGFGVIHPLPGIWDTARLNTAITLPIGVEAYASYALYVWLSGRIRAATTVNYARWSALGSLMLGATGQAAYHLMEAAGMRTAPWPITTVVACLPVVVLGMGAALTHMLLRANHPD